ncbi:MAG TPA: DUF4388 domain-containing protein [Pyrinomonadaceae bacterium]|nr:DUF4388 domain-containing protein [Pyrinomonadaceae bacterium]
MALTGHLSDLSLSELIEFFCNQRKTGCLNVLYPQGHGSFFLQSGSVVDAKIGTLRGIDAVYFALTLPNAAFEFKGSADMPERTINQPWTQVVLEGLRRLDEGITPVNAFPNGAVAASSDSEDDVEANVAPASSASVPAFLASSNGSAPKSKKPLIFGAAAVAVLASVVAIGVPAGWYHRSKPPVPVAQPVQTQVTPAPVSEPVNSPSPDVVDTKAAEAAALAAKRQRDKDRAKAREEKANAEGSANPTTAQTSEAKPGPKKVTVQVSYDESGRVVQASGADPTAVRIARQKHFPPGKAGSTSVTITMN